MRVCVFFLVDFGGLLWIYQEFSSGFYSVFVGFSWWFHADFFLF